MSRIQETLPSFLIIPLNLRKRDFEKEVWEDTCRVISNNRKYNCIQECFLGRKNWPFNSESEKWSLNFLNSVLSNKTKQSFILDIINSYFKLDTKYVSNSTSDYDLNLLSDPKKSVDLLNQELKYFKENKQEFATIVRYERKCGNKNVKSKIICDWIVIKLGADNVKLKDSDADIFKCLCRMFNASYDLMTNNSYKLTYDDNFTIKLHQNMPIIKTNSYDSYNSNVISSNNSTFFELQNSVGDAIFEKINKSIVNNNEQILTSFKVILLIPPRLSLKDQTVKRIKQNFSNRFIVDLNLHLNVTDEPDVYMAQNGKKLDSFINFIKTAKSNKNCLYLIIQDECHWGMDKNSILDKYLNNQTMFNSENIYVLHVSATPYNIETLSKEMNWNVNNQVIYWDDIANEETNKNYNGLKKLIQVEKIRQQSEQSRECVKKAANFKEIAHLFINKKLVENMREKMQIAKQEISIIIEYLVTLHYILLKESQVTFDELNFNRNFPLLDFITEETQQILQELINVRANGEGSLVLLRMNNSVIAESFQKWMRELLKSFSKQDQFDVVLDKDDENLWSALSSASQKRYKQWRGENSELQNLTYSDLVNIPMLLIVIEKARMGDTLPANFKYFDLRCRYFEENAAQTIYASLLQDVGRAFGYGERPTVFLSKFIFKCLKSDYFMLKPHQTLKKEPSKKDDNKEYENPLDLWKIAKNHQFFETNKLDAALNRRFLLSAHPQSGKTGAFLRTVQKFIQLFSQTNAATSSSNDIQMIDVSNRNNNIDPDDYKTLLIELKNIEENILKIQLNLPESDLKTKWKRFHYLLGEYQQVLTSKGLRLNHEFCIDRIKDCCNKYFLENPLINILDLGCGSAQIAQYFYDPTTKKFLFKGKKKNFNLNIRNVDLRRVSTIPLHINIDEINISGISSKYDEKSFEIVVFCCALWGSNTDTLNYIQQAHKLIREHGRLIILENVKSFNSTGINKIDFILSKTNHLFYYYKNIELSNGFVIILGQPSFQDETDEMLID